MNATSLAFRTPEPARLAVTVAAVGRDDADVLLRLCDEHAGQTVLEHGQPAPRDGLLEFHEALFDTPLRAWAWLARVDEAPVGYAFATVGFSLAGRGYSLQLDALYVREPWPPHAVETALFAQVAALAQRLGCVQLQWTAPSWNASARRFDDNAARHECVRYFLPLPASAG
ncbi:MAG TPA: hypothetical protein VGD42_16840 [Lysobacter sp.]